MSNYATSPALLSPSTSLYSSVHKSPGPATSPPVAAASPAFSSYYADTTTSAAYDSVAATAAAGTPPHSYYQHYSPGVATTAGAASLAPAPPLPPASLASPSPVVPAAAAAAAAAASPLAGSPAPAFYPAPVLDPVVDAELAGSIGRVRQLAATNTEAAYAEELSGSRYASAKARANVTEATVTNLERESAEALQEGSRQRQEAAVARRRAESAARQAGNARYKQLSAERDLIEVDAKRLREEARVARLAAAAAHGEAEVHLAHHTHGASAQALAAARDSVSQTRDSTKVSRQQLCRSSASRVRAESLLRDSYAAVSEASLDINKHSSELIHAAEREREAVVRKDAARSMEAVASSYLNTYVDPLSPVKPLDSSYAVADIESARLAERVADSTAAEARYQAMMANDKLRGAEDRLVTADSTARVTDAHFRDAAVEVEVNRHRAAEAEAHHSTALAIERENKLQAQRSKEQVIANAQDLARRRATLKRAKDKLGKLQKTGDLKRKEAIRQVQQADVAEKLYVAKLGQEQQSRVGAETATYRALAAKETLSETKVGYAYAKHDEVEAQRMYEQARIDAGYVRSAMESEVAHLRTLETIAVSPVLSQGSPYSPGA